MTEKLIELLSKNQVFMTIPKNELTQILSCINPKIYHYKKNQYITMEGEPSIGVGILISGSAMITKENSEGNRMIIATINSNEMFGEVAAFSENALWPASVIALEECSVLFLPSKVFGGGCGNACEGHKTMILNMLRIFSDKTLMLNKKVTYLIMKTIRGKISAFLLEQAKAAGSNTFILSMKRNELADFLNVARPSLSREMGFMRDEGLIEFYRSSIRIKDKEGLKKFIE